MPANQGVGHAPLTALAPLAFAILGSAPATASVPDGTRFLHQPDVATEAIVFVYGDDLWTAPLAGGRARRLTSRPGRESHPRYSPDGSRIAFSAESGGNVDVYVMPAEGGPATRLTYHPAGDRVEGWSPDGARVLFGSTRVSDHFRPRLHTIDASGGHPDVFPMHKAFRGAFSPQGRRLAYTPTREAFHTWKRYRGGETSPIWLVNLTDYSHVEIPHVNASDTSPVWMGDAVYFRSDRGGVMSLYRYEVATGALEELHRNGTTDIDSLAGGGGRLVFSSGGYVYVYEEATREVRQVPIHVSDDRVETARRRADVSKQLRNAAPSPDGTKIAFEARGELLVVSVASGVSQNLTRTSGVAERGPAWSPDGKRLAYFSDASGEYELVLRDASGEGEVTPLETGSRGLGYRLSWSPDGRRLAYLDRDEGLWLVDAAGRGARNIASRIRLADSYAWSPDGRLIAFPRLRPTLFRALTLYSVDSDTTVAVTDGIGDAHHPAFARDGGTLYFLGSTEAGKIKTGLDLSVRSHFNEVNWSVYGVRLGTSGDEPRLADGPVGFEKRIGRLPFPAGRYERLAVAADGGLLVRERPSERTFAGEARLRRLNPETGAVADLIQNVATFEVAADGGALVYRAESGWGVIATSAEPTDGDGRIDLASLRIEVDPVREWRQMFTEAWRNQRDFFYDEELHGVDWKAVRRRYEAYLPELRHRSDLDFVLRHMVGELVNSHISVGGGERDESEQESVGLLGADYEVVDGYYRVKRIVAGTYWDEERGPLAAPGIDVAAGDYLLEVNGRELRHPTNLYSLFVGRVGSPVVLRVNDEPRLEGSRLVKVVPIAGEASLRRRDWIERTRRDVDQLSGGRIAYVYQPDTGGRSLREFDRYFFPQSDRQAVLIDERFNDGGDDPDYQLDILDRQQVHWYKRRTSDPFKSPFSLVAGPKAMLVNAEAGSGGDVYPYQFKLRGLGKTVGTRTWGGVNGGGAGVPLLDGGYVRVPNLGSYAPDGSYILENSGLTPDVVVEVYPADDHAGRDPQLEKAVEILLTELAAHPPPGVPRLEKVNRSLEDRPD